MGVGWSGDRAGSVLSAPELPASAHRFVVVDVETTGLYPSTDRVLSIAAIALDERGRPETQFVSLIDPGCDPGPVHIHGLTRDRLAGAPCFADVRRDLGRVLDGRVMVAHNAAFDYGFLAAEAKRAEWALPIRQRLCTLALSRRLGLDVPNHQLSTLTRHWGVSPGRAHDAYDDARALAGIFAHSVALADQLGLTLPMVTCEDGRGRPTFPQQIVRAPCAWVYPGPLHAGQPLVQGMKVTVTGATTRPREVLVGLFRKAGLDVTGSVSKLTSFLVSNDARSGSSKCNRALAVGIPIVDEPSVLRLLQSVRPGVPKAPVDPAPALAAAAVPPQRVKAPLGPMSRRRVLVLGGPHDLAARVRADVIARGGAAAVNLSANVTELVILDGAENDPRIARAAAAGIPVHRDLSQLGLDGIQLRPGDHDDGAAFDTPGSAAAAAVLPRGGVIDLPAENIWTVNVAWRADALADGAELDIVAFLVDSDFRVTAHEDFVFYNAPLSPDGAVGLTVDGDSEQAVRIDLSLLPDYCTRVVVAAAVNGDCTFGDIGAVTLSVDGASSTIATTTLDAATTERSLLLAEVYRRNGIWRVRSVGQGYDDGLAHLATLHGVVVDEPE